MGEKALHEFLNQSIKSIQALCSQNIIQLLTVFEDNSSLVWPKNWSVAWSCRLRATDPFEGQTNLHIFKIFLFTLSTRISIRCFQYPLPSSPRIWTTPRHCDFSIMLLIEPMKIRLSVNSQIADNRLMNCWPINRTVLQLIGILLLTVKMLCIYCIAFK